MLMCRVYIVQFLPFTCLGSSLWVANKVVLHLKRDAINSIVAFGNLGLFAFVGDVSKI